MRCPFCQARDSRVTDSRSTDDGIRRRRECTVCGERFSTMEMPQHSTVQVVKKDGRREEFSREKLMGGLRRACTKRPVSVAELEAVVADIESRIMADSRAEVPSSVVGELAMEHLRDLDHIAYIRFASVYRSFSDLDSLKQALTALEEGRVPGIEERTLQLPLIDAGDSPVLLAPRSVPAPRERTIAESAG